MEKQNTAESLRLLSNAHTISWSASDEETKAKNASLATPLENAAPRHQGLVQAKVFRQGNNNNSFKMCLEWPEQCHLLYTAEKKGKGYSLHDGTHGGALGSLTKIAASGNSTAGYSLEIPNESSPKGVVQVAKILYEVPSVLQTLKDSPPRRAHVSVAGRYSVETKEPHCSNGGRRGLDFRGRGREPSCKNMQLQNSDGKLVLQMVKWSKDTFHVDFAHPFDAFHAFGFALAQFDL